MLPWQKGTAIHDGLPDRRLMMRVWLAVTILEDVPQLILQVTVLAVAGTDDGLLGPLSITFSVAAILWRGLRKAIYFVPANLTTAESSSAVLKAPMEG